MKSAFPQTGKVRDDFLGDYIFPWCGASRPEVVAGPQYGVDISVVSLSDGRALVTATDPASLIPTLGLQESAWLSVHITASDIATSGCLPQYAQFCLNLPPTLSAMDFDAYWQHISRYCQELGTAITGGHTGRAEGQNSTLAGGVTMFSCVERDQVVLSNMARPGDELILAKEAALISTAVLALSFPEKVLQHCGKEVLDAGQHLFYQTSAVGAALSAVKAGLHDQGVRAMHDVTEGGVLGAVYEMMTASGCGVEIWKDKIAVGHAQQSICRLFGIDPLCSVGAGAVLISAAGGKGGQVVEALKAEGFNAAVIGEVKEINEGKTVRSGTGEAPLQQPGEDPYWKAFFRALKNGWK